MGLFKKILVPVDGSRYSLNAVCLAARLAKIHGSELRIFHVIDETLLDQLARFSEKDRERCGRSFETAPGHSSATCAVRPIRKL